MQYITKKLRPLFLLFTFLPIFSLSLPLYAMKGGESLRQRRGGGLPQPGLLAAQAALRVAPSCLQHAGTAVLVCLKNPVTVLLTAGYGFAYFGPGALLSMVPMPQMLRHLTNVFLAGEQAAVAAHALTVINQKLAAQALEENNVALLQYSLELAQLLGQIPQLATIANVEIKLEPSRLVYAVENSQWDMAEVLIAYSNIDLNHDRGLFLRGSLTHIGVGGDNAPHAHAFAQRLISNTRLGLTPELFFAVIRSGQRGLITPALVRGDLALGAAGRVDIDAADPIDQNNLAHLCAQNPDLRTLVGAERLARLNAATYNQQNSAGKLPVEVMFSAVERDAGANPVAELSSYIDKTTNFYDIANSLFRRALQHDGMREAGLALALARKDGALNYETPEGGEYPLDLSLRLGDPILFETVLGNTPLAIIQNKHLSGVITKGGAWDPRQTAWKLLILRHAFVDGVDGAAAQFVDAGAPEEVMPPAITLAQILEQASRDNLIALRSYYNDPLSDRSGSILVQMILDSELYNELIFRDALARLSTPVANPLLVATPATGSRSLLSHLAVIAAQRQARGEAPHPAAALIGRMLSSGSVAGLMSIASQDEGRLFPLMVATGSAAPFLATIAQRPDANIVLTPFLMCAGAACSERLQVLAIEDVTPARDPSRPPAIAPPAAAARDLADRAPASEGLDQPGLPVALLSAGATGPVSIAISGRIYPVALAGGAIVLCGPSGAAEGHLVARVPELLADYAAHDVQVGAVLAHDEGMAEVREVLGAAAAAAHAGEGLPPNIALVLSRAPQARASMPMQQQVACAVGLVGMDLVRNWDAISYTLAEFGIIDPNNLQSSEGFLQRWQEKVIRVVPYYSFALLVARNLDPQRPLLGSVKVAAKLTGVYAIEKVFLLPNPPPSKKPIEERGVGDFVLTYSPYIIGAGVVSVVQTGVMVIFLGTSGMGLPVAGSLIAKEAGLAMMTFATPCMIAYLPQNQSQSWGTYLVPKVVGATVAVASVLALTPVLGLAAGTLPVTAPVAGFILFKAVISGIVIFAPINMLTRVVYNSAENYFSEGPQLKVTGTSESPTQIKKDNQAPEEIQVEEEKIPATEQTEEEDPNAYEL